MTLYNALIDTGVKTESYSVKTECKIQRSVPERLRVIDELTKNYGEVLGLWETDNPHTHIGLIEL